MLVFWRKKLVIFSVPKTGTSAIDKVLAPHADVAIKGPPILKHMPVYRYNRFMQPLMDVVNGGGFDRFAMVREPLDWLGSWYKYRARPELDGTPNSTKGISFDEFVLEAMKGKPAAFADVGSQARFLKGGVGPARITHLYQYEQMDQAIAFLEKRTGIEMNLSRVNASPKRDFALSDDVAEKYRRKKTDDYEIWDAARKP